jgi:protein gp37
VSTTPVQLSGGSKIEWTDYTFNPWWGCARVSPACLNCYAETFAHRLGMDLWGKRADRRFFGDKHWNEPLRWDRRAAREGVRRRVFCASMADVFEDNEALEAERLRLWSLIDETPHLDWLLLTKRPENITSMVPLGWMHGEWPRRVWAGTTVEDQRRAAERLPHLAMAPAAIRFVSAEPLLEAVDLRLAEHGVSWLIGGGESGHGARPVHPDWARSLRDQAVEAGAAFLWKQWGEWAPMIPYLQAGGSCPVTSVEIATPDGSRRGEMVRVGKKAAGRELDGRTWTEFPA